MPGMSIAKTVGSLSLYFNAKILGERISQFRR
jgi:hypothetical protein